MTLICYNFFHDGFGWYCLRWLIILLRDFMRQTRQVMEYNKRSSIQLATISLFSPSQNIRPKSKFQSEHGHGFYGSNFPKPFSDDFEFVQFFVIEMLVVLIYEFRSVVDRVVRNQIYLVSNSLSYRSQFFLIINNNRLYLSSCSVRMRYHKQDVRWS